MDVLVTGASGLIGSRSCRRSPRRPPRPSGWCAATVPTGVDAIALGSRRPGRIDARRARGHRRGRAPRRRGIGDKRWTDERKRRILESRTAGHGAARRHARRRSTRKPRVLVSASAVGYYGRPRRRVLTEASAPGDDFLAERLRAVGGRRDAAADAGIRVVTSAPGSCSAARRRAQAAAAPVQARARRPRRLGQAVDVAGSRSTTRSARSSTRSRRRRSSRAR